MMYLTSVASSHGHFHSQQAIKEENLKHIFLTLRARGTMTRIDLARVTGLSAATVSALVEELLLAGFIVETGPVKTERIGRKPINLRIRPEGRQIPSFAISRRGVQYVLYDLELKPIEAAFIEHDTARYDGFEALAPDGNPDAGADFAALIHRALSTSRMFDPSRAPAVCVAFPGIYLPEKEVFSMSALRTSFSRSSMEELEQALGIPLFFGSTAMAHAYAEKLALDELGERVDSLIYLYVRDGVGAGLLCDGSLFTGASGISGEIGHITVSDGDERCDCGNRGCLEQYVNLDAIVEQVRLAMPGGEAGGPLTLESIREALDSGRDAVIRAMDDIAEKLVRGLYDAVCLTGIRRVAIGGGIERLGDEFLKILRARAEKCGGLLMRGVTIDYARSGPSGDTLGIARYYMDKVIILGPQRYYSEM